MTRAQEIAVENLKKAFVGFYGYAEQHEIKYEKVEECDGGIVYVSLEVGRKNDEGTMLEVIGRNNLSVCVGPQGGYFKYSDSKSHYRRTFQGTTAVICKCQWK